MQHFIVPNQNLNTTEENKMGNIAKVIGVAMIGVVIIIASGLLFSLPVMWLWNGCLIAAIPGIKSIGWLQAWGILILCGLLFKSSVTTKNQ
jgi:hypothetical protein